MAAEGGDELSAFDRLYQRLVVQGQSVGKKKKSKKPKGSGAKRRDEQRDAAAEANGSHQETVVEPIPELQAVTVATEAKAQDEEADEALDEAALACVHRLKMRRNLRRAGRHVALSNEGLLRIAMTGEDNAGDSVTRRRVPLRRTRPKGTQDSGTRQWMRLESIAAMLYRRTSKERAATESPPQRVLHDFCFPVGSQPAFQSQIHYTVDSHRHANAVPLPPTSEWMQENRWPRTT